jgi:hypothetical protein
MTNALRSSIQQLASTFAAAVVSAIRGANLDDILSLAESGGGAESSAPTRSRTRRTTATATAKKAAPAAPAAAAPSAGPARKSKGGRLRRRSAEDIAKALAQVVSLVKTKKGGLRAEQIRAQLKMESKEMPRILKEGLSKKVLKSRGQKRSTTYTAA